MTTAHQIIHALRWNAIGRLSAQLITWAITLVVMRLLSPSDYGLMGLAVIINGFFALFNDLGAPLALIQQREIDATLITKVYGLLLLCNFVLYLMVVAGAPYFAAFFDQPRLIEIVRVLGISLILGALGAVPSALLQRDLRFKAISLIEFTSTIMGSVTALLFALSGFGVWALVVGSLVKRTVDTISLLKLTHFRMLPQFNFVGLGSILMFGTKMSAAQIVWYINVNFDGFLIGKILGQEALGLYSVAYNLALLPASKIISLSNQIAFSAYSRMQDEHARVAKYFQESVALASLVFFPTCWGMSAVADDLVAVVLGPKWQPAAIVLRIVALGVPYRALVLLMNPLVTGIGEPGVSLKNTLTSFFIISSGMAVGIQWGLTGLCIGALIAMVVSVTVNLNRNLRLLDMHYTRLLEISFPSMIAAAIMYAALLIAHSGMFGGMSSLLRLSLEIGLAVVIYGALTLAFNRSIAIRSLQLIRGIRR